jgi:DNA-binding NarL/FixJ family response regulator
VNRARHLLPDALNRLAPQRLLWLAAVGLMITPRFTELLEFEASRVGGHPLAESVVAALRRQPKHYLTVATIPATSTAHEAAASVGLTPRELEVLHALATGGSNATIASGLYLSENTVKTHLAALYRKLGVESRSDAISTARRLGLL